MGNEFKINGDVVERQEWEALRKELPDTPQTHQAVVDNSLTETELNGILDANKNGQISFDDFKGWPSNRFDNVAQILSRHGFNLEKKLIDTLLPGARLTSLFHNRILFKIIPNELWSSREFILAMVKQDGEVLQFADPKLQADRDVVLTAVKQDGEALQFADPKLQADRDVVLTAVKASGRALAFADPPLQEDLSFLTQLALINIGVLEYIYRPLRDDVWQNIVKVKDWGSLLPKESLFTYNSWKQAMEDHYDIEFFRRFRSFEVLYFTVTLRHNLRPSPLQPLAIVNYPKEGSGVFVAYPLVDRLTELGYQVFYYEDAKEAEVKRDLAQATQGGEKKADLIVWIGHGTATTLSLSGGVLGGSEGEREDETRYIDTGDFDKSTPDIPLAQFIKPTGDLILVSCSSGEGKEANPNNLANTIARILPKGVTLHASDKPMNISDISRDPSGKLNVTWTEDSLYTPKGGAQ